jgi:hypothetical protein
MLDDVHTKWPARVLVVLLDDLQYREVVEHAPSVELGDLQKKVVPRTRAAAVVLWELSEEFTFL